MGKAPPSAKPKPTTGKKDVKKSKKSGSTDAEKEARRQEIKVAQAQYGRGDRIKTTAIKDRKQKANLTQLERKYKTAAIRAKDAEILLENTAGLIEVDHDLERTYRVRQDEIRAAVSVETARKGFSLKLDSFGPYNMAYTRNGRHMLLAGRKGHVATMDWRDGKLGCELFLNETVRDATWLHNSQYFAVAQKKYVYIYDQAGVELHKLDKHIDVAHLEFLPFHFLLASIGNAGHIKYQDTSTGQLVCEVATKLGSPSSFAQNPANAIIHAGHQNGQVTLWSPNSTEPLVKILAHKGPVRSIGLGRTGTHMVTTGQDSRMAVWDLRMMKQLHNYALHRPASSVAVSDRGLTAVGWGSHVSVWSDLFTAAPKSRSPYIGWGGDGHSIERVRWCPFEDVLGVSHADGFDSLLVPGAGEPNYDALELNPFETEKQRREGEVKMLLNKLQPGMISLDPSFIGRLSTSAAKTAEKTPDAVMDAKAVERFGAAASKSVLSEVQDLKRRGRGRNSALRRFLRKRGNVNVVDEKRVRVEAALEGQKVKVQDKIKEQQEQYGPALARFARNR